MSQERALLQRWLADLSQDGQVCYKPMYVAEWPPKPVAILGLGSLAKLGGGGTLTSGFYSKTTFGSFPATPTSVLTWKVMGVEFLEDHETYQPVLAGYKIHFYSQISLIMHSALACPTPN